MKRKMDELTLEDVQKAMDDEQIGRTALSSTFVRFNKFSNDIGLYWVKSFEHAIGETEADAIEDLESLHLNDDGTIWFR